MLRCLLLSLALCLPTAPLQAGTTTATFDIGGVAVRLDVPEGYARVSQRSPELLAFQQGMLPQTNRLVETLMTEADLTTTLAGGQSAGIAYQLQAMRALESVDIDAAKWPQLRDATIEQMGGIDMRKVMGTLQQQADRTLEAATDGEVGVRLGDPSQPALYATDDPDAVHFSMVLPLEVEVAGETTQQRIAAACMLTVVAERLVLLYAFLGIKPGDDEQQVRARVQAAVDALGEATRRANSPQHAADAQG